jgi:hypothetical protein
VVVQKGAVYLLVGVLGHTSEEVEATGVVDESELVLGSEQSHVLNKIIIIIIIIKGTNIRT